MKCLTRLIFYPTETSNNAVSDLQKQFESQGVTMQQLEQEVGQKSSEITSKEEEIVKARLEITRSVREVEDLKKKMLTAEKSREELQADRTRLKADIVALKTNITEHKHQELVEKKKMDQTKQSVTSLEHNLKRSNAALHRQQKEVQKAITSAKALRNQIKSLEMKVEKQRKALSQTEEEVCQNLRDSLKILSSL